MMDYFRIISVIVSIATGVFAIWKYFTTKRRELQWKKAEFLLLLGQSFDSDNHITEAVNIIEGRSVTKIEGLLDQDGMPLDPLGNDNLQKLDKLLNFLDRMAYLLKADVLTMDEARNFGWYYKKIVGDTRLTNYCNAHGFQDVVAIGTKI